MAEGPAAGKSKRQHRDGTEPKSGQRQDRARQGLDTAREESRQQGKSQGRARTELAPEWTSSKP